MGNEHAVLAVTAAIAFGTALTAVIREWIKADGISEDIERAVRSDIHRMRAAAEDSKINVAVKEVAMTRIHTDHVAELESTPTTALADDETALSRLFFGWGTAGMLVGMALGAALWGAVGALLGGVAMVTVSIGLVVVGVLAVDRVRAAHAKQVSAEHETPEGALVR